MGERGVGCQREKDTTSVKSFGNSNLKVNRYPYKYIKSDKNKISDTSSVPTIRPTSQLNP